MIVKGYGIELIRLKHSDIELVRNWRNSSQISQYMEFREYITIEMQEKWFQSIDTIFNNYFIISVKGNMIGLINGSQINWEKKETGNGGIFIWETNYLKTIIPLRASLLLTDMSIILGLERTYIKVLKDNIAAINYNISLGYELLPNQSTHYNQQYVLTKENYLSKTAKLKSTLQQKENSKINVIVDDPNHSVSQFLLRILLNLSEENKSKINLIVAQ